jgi:16S rRNA processing protein RimM
LIVVGIVRRPHGVTGEVSVEPVTDFPERFAPGARFQWRGGHTERDLEVVSARPHGARILVRFDGVGDVDAARALAGGDLGVPEEETVPPPDDFYYHYEVEGWRCEDSGGRLLGRAVGLERTAGGALLLVDTGGSEPVPVPFVSPIVVSVDRATKRVVLDPPAGLMELSLPRPK